MRLKSAVIRGAIPLAIMSTISLIMRWQGEDADQVRSTFIVGLIITAVAAATVIYDIEGWSLRKQSVVHLAIMAVTVLPLLLLSGWFSLNSSTDYFGVVGIFLLVGLVTWSVIAFIFSRMTQRA